MNPKDQPIVVFGCMILGGLFLYSYCRDDDSPQGFTEGRNFNPSLTPAREESEPSRRNIKVVKPPNFSPIIDSTTSRIAGTARGSKLTTSMKTGKLITSDRTLYIRKYPPEYYTLSRNQQWRYRKNFKTPQS